MFKGGFFCKPFVKFCLSTSPPPKILLATALSPIIIMSFVFDLAKSSPCHFVVMPQLLKTMLVFADRKVAQIFQLFCWFKYSDLFLIGSDSDS